MNGYGVVVRLNLFFVKWLYNISKYPFLDSSVSQIHHKTFGNPILEMKFVTFGLIFKYS